MNTKKYLIIAGVTVVILGGIFASTLAAVNYFYPKPMIVQINSNGTVLLRGTVNSVSINSLTVKGWGGSWIVNTSSSTQFMPGSNISQFKVGDFVGVQGTVNQNASWMIDATLIRDWTVKQVQNNKPECTTDADCPQLGISCSPTATTCSDNKCVNGKCTIVSYPNPRPVPPPITGQCNVHPDANGNCPAGCVNYGNPLGCVTQEYKDYCSFHPGQCPL